MNNSTDTIWRDRIARRPLTPAERAEFEHWLAGQPGPREFWEDEARLSAALKSLRPAPVPSNFAARVLAEVRRLDVSVQPTRRPWWHWWFEWRHAVPVATAVFALALTLGLQARHRTQVRVELANGISALPLEGLAQTQLWRDFDPIHVLPEGPLPAGEDLAAAFD
jgi:ferric-dicitrate binding protein FerR (iron transport regulator)